MRLDTPYPSSPPFPTPSYSSTSTLPTPPPPSGLPAYAPMDGFHLTRAQLSAMPDPMTAHARRGAEFTFDGAAFLSLIESLREPSPPSPSAPPSTSTTATTLPPPQSP